MDEKLHYLNILIELTLYPRVRCLSEGTNIKDIDKERRAIIESFWGDLPEAYKIEGYKQITLDKLKRMIEEEKQRKEERYR